MRKSADESTEAWNRAKPKYHNVIATCEHHLCTHIVCKNDFQSDFTVVQQYLYKIFHTIGAWKM